MLQRTLKTYGFHQGTGSNYSRATVRVSTASV